MQSFLRDLFLYHHHFNPLLINLVEQHEALIPAQTVGLLSHIFNAHQIWNARILGEAPNGVFQEHAFDVCRALELQNHQTTLEILDAVDLSNLIRYTNTKGQTFENSVRDILFHVANHTTHHRGQIVAAVRQVGGEPFASDFILFAREKLV